MVTAVGWSLVRIFVAGATGVIGVRLVPLLVAEGHTVAGMTRSAQKAGQLGLALGHHAVPARRSGGGASVAGHR